MKPLPQVGQEYGMIPGKDQINSVLSNNSVNIRYESYFIYSYLTNSLTVIALFKKIVNVGFIIDQNSRNIVMGKILNP